jgi:hypothetical protein
MKKYGGVEVWLHFSGPPHYMVMNEQLHVQAALPPGNIPGTHWRGGWEDPRTGLDAVG